jgi:hypothetical protein
VVLDGLEGGRPGDGEHASFGHREVRRDAGEAVLGGSCVLGEGAVSGAEHEVALGEAGDEGADTVDDAGEVEAGNRVAGASEPERQPGEVRPSGHQVPHPSVDAGGGDPHEDVVVAEGGPRDLAELEDVGGP